MGSVPALNPPQQIDVGKLVQLKNLIQAQPLEMQQRQQAIQEGALNIQKSQRDLAREDALNKAYSSAFTNDPSTGAPKLDENKFMSAASASGWGSAAQPVLEHLATYHKTLNENAQLRQKLNEGERDEAGSVGYALQQSKYDPHLAKALIGQRLNDPSLDPQHQQTYAQASQAIDQGLAQGDEQARQVVQKIADPMVAGSEKYSKIQLEGITAQARQLQAQTGAKRFQAELPGGELESPEKAGLQSWLKKNPGKTADDFLKAKAGWGPGATFAIQAGAFAQPPAPAAASAPTPEAALQKLDPRMRATVKQVGEYQQKKSEILQRLPGAAKENFNTALDAVYPNYSEQNYDARHKMVLDYTSGKTSQQINAINTAGGHLSALADAADALKSNNVQLVNRVANAVGVAIGKDPVTTFNTIVHRVGPELAAAYIQGGGGEGERGTTAKDFDPALGPDQLKSNLGITAKLLGSKISSNENQWKTTMERDDFRDRFLSPEAKAAFARLSPSTKTTSKTAAGGFKWESMPEHK